MRDWRIATWCYALGQSFEALWLGLVLRAATLLVLSALFLALVELVVWLRRHVRWGG